MQLKTVKIEKSGDTSFVLGQTHFIKSVEDIHEALVGAVPGIKLGLAFCEASGKCLVRWSGTDPATPPAFVLTRPQPGIRSQVLVSRFVFDLFLVNGESHLQVEWQSSRMVLRVRVEPQTVGIVTPCLVDSPLEEMLAQSLTDELSHQAEKRNLDLMPATPIQLDKPSRDAINQQNVNLVFGVVDDSRQCGVGKTRPAHPIPLLPNGIEQETVVGNGWLPGVDDGKPFRGR
jgi:hypothetical protein